jgi:putative transposase
MTSWPFFIPLFTGVRGEAVWKVVLGGYFATLARMRKRYPTDLSDAEWKYIEPHLPDPEGCGRPRTHTLREILNAVFYVLKSGCQWRLLPHDFPRWPTVYWYFRKWRIDGTWERINRCLRERLLRERLLRVRLDRNPQPSAGVVDSQSLKSTSVGAQQRGYDGGKKVKGLKSLTSWWTSWWTKRVWCSKRRSTARTCWIRRGSQGAAAAGERAIAPSLAPVAGGGLARGGQGRREWVRKTLGWSVELLERPKKPAPEGVLMGWAAQWAKEGVAVDWRKLLPAKG